MFRKRMILVVISVAITVVGSLSTGSAAINADPRVDGVVTNFKTARNGVIQSNVTLPGIPKKLPIQGEVGGKMLPCTHGVSGSTQEAALCAGPSQNFFFQWWMTVYRGGRVEYAFSQWYDWSGDGATVTYFDTECFDNGGYYHFHGCSTSHTRVGGSAVKVHGSWTYRCCFNTSNYDENRPSSDVTAAADGSIWGTVYSG